MTVGERIRNRRKELKLSQEELGKRLGVTKSAVSRVEKGKEAITTDRLGRYADALETSCYDLLGWNEPDTPFEVTKDKRKLKELAELSRGLNDEQLDNVIHYVKFLRKENGG